MPGVKTLHCVEQVNYCLGEMPYLSAPFLTSRPRQTLAVLAFCALPCCSSLVDEDAEDEDGGDGTSSNGQYRSRVKALSRRRMV